MTIDGGATVGYCATGSCAIATRAEHQDEERDHPGEDRAVDEEAGHRRARLAARRRPEARGDGGAGPAPAAAPVPDGRQRSPALPAERRRRSRRACRRARLLPQVRRRLRRCHGTAFTGVGAAQLLEAVDHHLLAGLQAVEDDPLAVLRRADLDRPRRRPCRRPTTTITVSPCDERCTACCGSVMALPPAPARCARARSCPAAGRPSGLGTSARSVTWPEVGSTAQVGEQQPAGLRVLAAVLQHDAHLRRPVAAGGAPELAAVEGAAQPHHVGGRLGEVDVERVDLLDHRQRRRLALADQRAFGDQRAADAARRSAPSPTRSRG